MDRREDPRFNLNVPVRFLWKVPATEPRSGTGTTRDASLKGVFVFTDACPPVGSAVRLNVMLPSAAGGSELVMRAQATVVRVESTNGAKALAGFAAATKRYVIEKHHGSPNDGHE
jgi:hypothetical protein